MYTPPGSLDSENPETHQVFPDEWRQGHQPQGLQPLQRQGSNYHANSAKEWQDYLQDYFISEKGAVSWRSKTI